MKLRETLSLAAVRALSLTAFGVAAQDAETEKAIERYRQMLKEDPWSNPGLLDSDRGEALWKTPRGPKNVTLEQCDLGKGPGKVEGAFAELPRYFKDADRVMDVETRLLWCMEKLQGFNRADLVKRPHPGRRRAGEGTWRDRDLRREPVVRAEIRGQARPAEGKGSRSRSARICSSAAPVRSISRARPAMPPKVCASGCRACRISSEPKDARKVIGEWPAYRVSSTHVMTMQHRLYDCYWQMRMPELQLGSEVSVALIAYLTKKAEGGEIAAPGLKR